MGFDIKGVNPKSDAGKEFHRNSWGWRPIADFIIDKGPQHLVKKCSAWHYNDGAGLNDEDARDLSRWMENAINSGRALKYVNERNSALERREEDVCYLCNGTGSRNLEDFSTRVIAADATHNDKPHPRAGKTGWCNACNGTGYKPHPDTYYVMEVDDLQEFSEFLAESGGFEIW